MVAAQDDIKPRLASITKEFDAREYTEGSATALHDKWLRTPAGQEDIAFLAAHYSQLHSLQKYQIPTELARTGLRAVVPLLAKALAENSSALAGVFYACRLGKPEAGFGKDMAPLVVPWIGRGRITSSDTAIEILPVLDPELAGKVFFVDEFVGLKSTNVHLVLSACNDAGLAVPPQVLHPLISAWESQAASSDAEYRISRGYVEALKALAVHDPAAAFAKAEVLMKANPHVTDKLSDLPLLGVGLSGLYDQLADVYDDPERFKALPEAAQFYFAVTYFESDCSNGGMSQALGNSTGDLLPIVRKAYQATGDTQGLAWLDWMCKPFGTAGPSTDRSTRNQQMDTMTPSYFEQESKLDEEWAETHRNDPATVPSSWILSVYVSKHAEAIKQALK